MEIDDEVRAITEALGDGHGLPQLTASGLVATCTACEGIMGARDRHCPSCGAPAGAVAESGLDRPALQEPSYEDEEFEVHEAVDPDEDDDRDDIEDAEEVATGEHEPVPVGGNGATPPPWAAPSPEAPDQAAREALVPRAQRTLRAGRRLARNWIEERRASGR